MEQRPFKEELRQQLRAKIKALSAEQRSAASVAAANLLQEQRTWAKASAILFYAPRHDELDLWPLLAMAVAAGKAPLLPKFDSASGHYIACEVKNPQTEIVLGRFGIREPAANCPAFPLNRLDLTLVPGIGFDTRGGRLGRGAGYYDRLLAQVSGTKCGVAFDEQIVAEVPIEPHDIPLDCILTPTRWLAASSARSD